MALMSILINYGFSCLRPDRLYRSKVLSPLRRDQCGPPADERSREACRRLGLRLAEWTATMIEGRKEAHPLSQSYERFQDIGKS